MDPVSAAAGIGAASTTGATTAATQAVIGSAVAGVSEATAAVTTLGTASTVGTTTTAVGMGVGATAATGGVVVGGVILGFPSETAGPEQEEKWVEEYIKKKQAEAAQMEAQSQGEGGSTAEPCQTCPTAASGGGGDGNGDDGDGGDGKKKQSSANQLNRDIKKGKAPKSVERADSPRIPHEKPHVHFKDGSALNSDGTWKHGGRVLSNSEKGWLQGHGWTLP